MDGSGDAERQKDLAALFKSAAFSLTRLYRESNNLSKRSYISGYKQFAHNILDLCRRYGELNAHTQPPPSIPVDVLEQWILQQLSAAGVDVESDASNSRNARSPNPIQGLFRGVESHSVLKLLAEPINTANDSYSMLQSFSEATQPAFGQQDWSAGFNFDSCKRQRLAKRQHDE